MTSKRYQVVDAVRVLMARAVPDADVRELVPEDGKAHRTDALGMIEVETGDPGDPDIDLSPPVYWWEHALPVQLTAYGADQISAKAMLDGMLVQIDATVAADRSLGGLCIYLDLRPGSDGEMITEGARTIGWADLTVVATYSTTTALG